MWNLSVWAFAAALVITSGCDDEPRPRPRSEPPSHVDALSAGVVVTAGTLTIETAIEPDPPREKGNTARVVVNDASGAPVTGAQVRVEYEMPAMGSMAPMRGGADAVEQGAGRYAADFDLPLGGSWTLYVSVKSASTSTSGIARYLLAVGIAGITALGGEGAVATPASGDPDYICPMHPSVHSKQPGTCPICAMELTRAE